MATMKVLALLFLAPLACLGQPRSLSLTTLPNILGSDTVLEHGGSEESFTAASSHQWARHEATYRRRLSASADPSEDFPKFGVIVCDDSPGSGFVRRRNIESALSTTLEGHALYNHDDMTCFKAHMTYETATSAPPELIIHPFTHSMKLSDVSKVLLDVPRFSHRVTLDLCPSQNGRGEAIAQRFSEMASALFHEDSSHHAELTENFFFSSPSHRERAGTERATLYQEAFQQSSDSAVCRDHIDKLSFEHDHFPAAHINMVHVSGFEHFFESVVSQASASQASSCFLSVLALFAEQPEVCIVAHREMASLRNQEAQWIVQSNNPSGGNMRPFHDNGITGTGQVVAVSDTGLDTDNCYFRNEYSGTQITKDGSTYSSKRKVIQYVPLSTTYKGQALFDDTDYDGGHGTHVVGSVLGRKSTDGSTESTGMADGVAYDAKVAFYDISYGADLLLTPGTAIALFDPGYNAGARIHSASWGTSR